MRETQIRSLGQEDSLKEGMATHSSILAWRIPWTEEPGGLWSVGSQNMRHNWSNWAHTHMLMEFLQYILQPKNRSLFFLISNKELTVYFHFCLKMKTLKHLYYIYDFIMYMWIYIYIYVCISDQIRSVAQSCPTLCDPMNMFVYTHVWIYMWVYLFVNTYIRIYALVFSLHLSTCLCVCLSLSVSPSIYLSTWFP